MLLTVVVQAGGESQRMGENKALLSFLGIPLIQRVVQRVKPIANELILTTNTPQAFSWLGLPLVGDTLPGRGALIGLHTALSAASNPFVAVVACDMPFVNPNLLLFQTEILIRQKVDLVVPLTSEGHEPFHAVYRRETCLPAVTKALDTGQKRMISWYSQVKVHEIHGEELRRVDPDGRAFLNVNTPEEFQAAEITAQAIEARTGTSTD